jgi:hypothetical protein
MAGSGLHDGLVTDAIPPEFFLSAYPESMRAIAERPRAIVRRAEPTAVEAVRPGWRLIGYDIPIVRRTMFFAFVTPEPGHVHLGFPRGVLMDDPNNVLLGTGVTLRARWVTLREHDVIEPRVLATLVREAARVTALSRSARLASVLDREARPDRP